MKLVFASHNAHKLKEICSLAPADFEILSLDDAGYKNEIPETGKTLRENALLKAKAAYEFSKLSSFADDTGLEIDSLGGAPGVFSARYAGEQCNFADNIVKVLKELRGAQNRNARFVSVIAFYDGGAMAPQFFEGVIKGKITNEPAGKNGFGYDPIFRPNGFNKTFAQMTAEKKNLISHRAIAIRKFLLMLKSYFAL